MRRIELDILFSSSTYFQANGPVFLLKKNIYKKNEYLPWPEDFLTVYVHRLSQSHLMMSLNDPETGTMTCIDF